MERGKCGRQIVHPASRMISIFSMKVGKPTFIMTCLNLYGSSVFFLVKCRNPTTKRFNSYVSAHVPLARSCVKIMPGYPAPTVYRETMTTR